MSENTTGHHFTQAQRDEVVGGIAGDFTAFLVEHGTPARAELTMHFTGTARLTLAAELDAEEDAYMIHVNAHTPSGDGETDAQSA